ncbi:hypothetical protein F503_01304 [Ophiostoma piceae UAMH 11346]|uniref:Uncharacterized protein n=1 Tax=Ophiostoma piceae (strain UAMH 11346) TaxID=1262450 RepID=S3CUC7_OPHP1|nr:hypothetical protein F503_01304 [Ophiostoma piceae UAMH 11346]
MAALKLFQGMIESYEAPPTPPAPYDRLGLLKLCYTHAGSSGSRSLAEAALKHAGLGVCLEAIEHDAATSAATSFADHLVDNLFLPLRAIAQCRSVKEDAGSSSDSDDEAISVTRKDSPGSQTLYIFPPSPMTQIDDDGDQSESGALAACLLSLLSLVEEDAVQLLREHEYTDANKITVEAGESVHDWPTLFSRFQAVVKGVPRTVQLLDSAAARTTSATTSDTIVGLDTADARLLALQSKIAYILSASGVDTYIDSILADTGLEDMDSAGGTSHLGRLMTLRLEGWWDGGRRNTSGHAESMLWIESSNFVEGE